MTHDAERRLARRFESDGFPLFALSGSPRSVSREHLIQIVAARDEFLRQMIEPEVRAVLQELADTRQQLDEAVDLNRSALKHQELRDERHRAVKAWHDEHKRAEAAEGCRRTPTRRRSATHQRTDRTCEWRAVRPRRLHPRRDRSRADAAGPRQPRPADWSARCLTRT